MGKRKEKQDAYYKEMREWAESVYRGKLRLDSIEDAFVRETCKLADTAIWSHKNRLIRNIQSLKYNYLTNKASMITACFKVSYESTSSIYAYMHSMHERGKVQYEESLVCTGSTFRSQDGEYRTRVIHLQQVDSLFKRYADVFEKVEELVLQRMEAGVMDFQTDFYYPSGFSKTRQYEDSVNSRRLPIRFYILCWFIDYYRIYTKTIENHANTSYQYIVYRPEDRDVFESILNDLGHIKYTTICEQIAYYFPDISYLGSNISSLACGQKIFPLTVIEALRTDDIHFDVWREIYINNMASNMVLNLICPSFPFINNWFYIHNAHSRLYDNVSMHDKYLHSSVAADISNQLKNIDTYNYTNRDRTKGPINYKFANLSKSIHKSIITADSDIRLTDFAVCVTSEYVGRTLRDIPSLIVNNVVDLGLDIVFTDKEVFTKHMFEYIYAFYCMNSKIGIIHGDLHMNNSTIFRLYYTREAINAGILPDSQAVYLIDNTAYMFEHRGLFSMLIDFSRAIIGDYARLKHEFSENFAERYFTEQRERVINIIYHHFPSIIDKYKSAIDSLLVNNFPLMFKILTAIDTYVIMSNIAAMFSIDDAFTQGQIKLAPGSLQLLEKLSAAAERLFTDGILAAIEGKIKLPSDIEWPNLVIIRDHFGAWKLTPERMTPTTTITEIFNSSNTIVDDIEDYDTWGPLLSMDKDLEVLAKYDPEGSSNETEATKRFIALKDANETAAIASLLDKYEAQEEGVLQFEQWSTM